MKIYPPDYPEEYINGTIRFFGRDFIVTPDVLIPRLETESLVRRARKMLGQSKNTTVIDIGCGSGIIGTSVADLVDKVIFLDISFQALQVAEQNFRTYYPDKKAQFIVSDLLVNLPKLPTESDIFFLTNLPYIRDEDWKNMSSDTAHEPRLALFGGKDTGFELYEKLFQELNSLEGENITSVKLLFEFGFDQRTTAEKVVKQYPDWKYSFFADYAGIERFGEIVIKN